MGAKHVVNPNQLKMFMTADELMKLQPNPHDMVHRPKWAEGDDFYGSPRRLATTDEFWDLKREENHAAPHFLESIDKNGIERPINIYHPAENESIDLNFDKVLTQDELGRDEISGVRQPLGTMEETDIEYPLTGPTIANGHHRVAAAYEKNPETLIPVTNFAAETDSWGDAVTGGILGGPPKLNPWLHGDTPPEKENTPAPVKKAVAKKMSARRKPKEEGL
jgi:hypothetical protein